MQSMSDPAMRGDRFRSNANLNGERRPAVPALRLGDLRAAVGGSGPETREESRL